MVGLFSRRIETPIGELLLAASDQGICRVSFPVSLHGKWFPWFDRYFSEVPHSGDHPLIRQLEGELEEYFLKKRKVFDTPIDLRGTEFHKKVWKRLLEVPYGSTITYGEIASEMGIVGGSRAVGGASGNNPIPIVVPCHRVVGSSGQLVGFGGGLALKERLLELEGARIPFG